MSFRTLSDLVMILNNGGSLDFDATSVTLGDLTVLVRNVPEGATIVLRGLDHWPLEDILLVSRNAPGKVRFVFSKS